MINYSDEDIKNDFDILIVKSKENKTYDFIKGIIRVKKEVSLDEILLAEPINNKEYLIKECKGLILGISLSDDILFE